MGKEAYGEGGGSVNDVGSKELLEPCRPLLVSTWNSSSGTEGTTSVSYDTTLRLFGSPKETFAVAELEPEVEAEVDAERELGFGFARFALPTARRGD